MLAAPQHVAAERVRVLPLCLVVAVLIPEQRIHHVALALQRLRMDG